MLKNYKYKLYVQMIQLQNKLNRISCFYSPTFFYKYVYTIVINIILCNKYYFRDHYITK